MASSKPGQDAISPAPILEYTIGADDQTLFHKKPNGPLHGSAPALPIFESKYEPPAEFGELSKRFSVLKDPHSSGKRSHDTHEYVFARRDHGEENKKHGLDRVDSDKYDRIQHNPLMHQELRSYANYDGAELSAVEKRFQEIAIHYPDIPKGLMKGAFMMRKYNTTQPQAEQTCKFAKVAAIPEIFELIIRYIIPRHEDLTNLFCTSQYMAGRVQSIFMQLDASGGHFSLYDQFPLNKIEAEQQSSELNGDSVTAQKCKDVIRGFSPYCMISPVRPEKQGALQRRVVNKYGYPITARVEKSPVTDLETAMKSHYKLLHLVQHNGSRITHLILQSLPWLDITALWGICRKMKKLEVISIHNCFLMHFGVTCSLLEMINKENDRRAEQKLPHIVVDFTPFYFKGPHYKEDGSGHVGEYGLVPEDVEWLDTTWASTVQLLKIWDLCKKGGQDFFTPGTGFRRFLDRLPFHLHTMPTILKSIAAIYDFNAKYRASDSYYHPARLLDGVENAMELTLWYDLIVACNGKPMDLKQLKPLVHVRNKTKLERCSRCHIGLPACFYHADILKYHVRSIICHGCQLTNYLETHGYRMHDRRCLLANRIFDGQNMSRDNIDIIKNITKMCPRGGANANICKGAKDIETFLTVKAPAMIKDMQNKIISMSGELDYKAIQDHENRIAKYRFKIGEAQIRKSLCGPSEVCRSWELNIRQYRADLAMQNGTIDEVMSMGRTVNSAQMRSMAPRLLGANGALPDPKREVSSLNKHEISSLDKYELDKYEVAHINVQVPMNQSVSNRDTSPTPAERSCDSESVLDMSTSYPTSNPNPSLSQPSHTASNTGTSRTENAVQVVNGDNNTTPTATQCVLPHPQQPTKAKEHENAERTPTSSSSQPKHAVGTSKTEEVVQAVNGDSQAQPYVLPHLRGPIKAPKKANYEQDVPLVRHTWVDEPQKSSSSGQQAAQPEVEWVPPHLRGRAEVRAQASPTQQAEQRETQYVPPHLRGLTEVRAQASPTQQAEQQEAQWVPPHLRGRAEVRAQASPTQSAPPVRQKWVSEASF